jgi:hypothetical protein
MQTVQLKNLSPEEQELLLLAMFGVLLTPPSEPKPQLSLPMPVEDDHLPF